MDLLQLKAPAPGLPPPAGLALGGRFTSWGAISGWVQGPVAVGRSWARVGRVAYPLSLHVGDDPGGGMAASGPGTGEILAEVGLMSRGDPARRGPGGRPGPGAPAGWAARGWGPRPSCTNMERYGPMCVRSYIAPPIGRLRHFSQWGGNALSQPTCRIMVFSWII